MDIEKKSERKNGYWYWIVPLLLLFLLVEIVYDTARMQNVFIKGKSLVTGIKKSTEKSNDEIKRQIVQSEKNIIS
jgi:hypothetical protein